MPVFAVHYRYVDQPAVVTEHRPAHRDFLRGLLDRGIVLAAGAYTDGPAAALLVFRADSAADVERPAAGRSVPATRPRREPRQSVTGAGDGSLGRLTCTSGSTEADDGGRTIGRSTPPARENPAGNGRSGITQPHADSEVVIWFRLTLAVASCRSDLTWPFKARSGCAQPCVAGGCHDCTHSPRDGRSSRNPLAPTATGAPCPGSQRRCQPDGDRRRGATNGAGTNGAASPTTSAAAATATNGYTGIDNGAPLTAVDTDHDGLTDDFEKLAGTNPLAPDTDADGLTDAFEALRSHTDPLAADTDHDGIADAAEVAAGSEPEPFPASPGSRAWATTPRMFAPACWTATWTD